MIRLNSRTTFTFLLSAVTTASFAQVANGGFESSFTSWTQAGKTLVINNTLGSGPTEGSSQAFLATVTDGTVNPDITAGTGVSPNTTAAALGVTVAELNGLGNGSAYIGSAISQTIHLNAGETLSFDWNFMTNQTYKDGVFNFAPSAANNDFAIVALTKAGSPVVRAKLADVFYGYAVNPGSPGGFDSGFSLTPIQNPFLSETGFHQYSFLATSTGNYTLGLGVISATTNPNPNGINSALLIDNVKVAVVPEPTSMLALGLGLAAMARKRRKSA